MERTKVIQYEGKSILVVDLKGITIEDSERLTEVISDSEEIIRNPENLKSGILVLTDITNAEVSLDGVSMMASYTEGNKTYVKASALVGSRRSLDVVKSFLEKETGREFKTGFVTREEACDWLIKQYSVDLLKLKTEFIQPVGQCLIIFKTQQFSRFRFIAMALIHGRFQPLDS